MPIRTAEELHVARKLVLEWASRLAFSVLERTKLVTAASELGRNALIHAHGGGTMAITELQQDSRTGLQLHFEDDGPGIPDIAQAMTDGFTTARSLGLGLGGARRLVNEFEIRSLPPPGTSITIRQWKRR